MCSTTAPARLTLAPDSRAPSAARAFLRQAHCPAHDAEVLDDALLLVSEVVTNAVRHGAPPVTLEVECRAPLGLQVRISDGDPAAPLVRNSGPDDESGRGVALVDMLSDDWGVEPREDGKAVWFLLRSH